MADNVAIHRTAIVAPDVEIGDGTIVGPFAALGSTISHVDITRIGPSSSANESLP